MSDSNVPIPVPGAPGMAISIDPVQLVNGILDCYKNVTIAKEQQQTLRTQICEQSRVYIAAIEANTKEFEMILEQSKLERMEFIKLVCDTIRQKDIDENSLQLCKMILDYLTSSNPMNSAGKALKFSEEVAEMMGRRI